VNLLVTFTDWLPHLLLPLLLLLLLPGSALTLLVPPLLLLLLCGSAVTTAPLLS
jgi:hypothetical protein